MQASGHDVDYCSLSEAKHRDLSDRIVVFIKPNGPEVASLHCRGIVIDLADNIRLFTEKAISTLISMGVSGIIFPNQYSMLRLIQFSYSRRVVFGVVHGTVFRVKPTSFERPFAVGYFGSREESQCMQEIRNEIVYQPFHNKMMEDEQALSDYLEVLGSCPFHLSVRPKKYKPPIKIIITAHCGSAIILSRDSGGAEDLLPSDYPYWTKGAGLSDIRETIKFARKTYLGPEWDKAMIQMKAVVAASTDDKIVSTYIDILCRVAEVE